MYYYITVEDRETRSEIRKAVRDKVYGFSGLQIRGYPDFGIIPVPVSEKYKDHRSQWYIYFDTEENMTKFIMRFL